MPNFEKQKLRSKFEARLLDAGAADNHAAYGDRKTEVIGSMSGKIVEIGPGTGANMRYYVPGTKVIGIEPNPVMHAPLQAKADEHGIDLEIRSLRGESIDVDDESVHGVVATLVLCGVDDPGQVIREARRILKPGGTYFFIEHVVAPADTRTRTVQKVLFRPHRWAFNGCEINRDTTALLRASQFDNIEIEDVDRGGRALWVRHQIVGTAQKAV